MAFSSLLIANRGEIAIRICRAAQELDLRSVGVYSEEDERCLHVAKSDDAHPLRGKGAAAYLDAEQLVAVAREAGCDAVHPGYGFLAENADFARRVEAAGLVFVGPSPDALALFGDKVRARDLAAECGVPTLRGTSTATSLDLVRAFASEIGPGRALVIKAVGGGGGRGMRVVREPGEIEAAYERCQSEARAAFGNGDVYCEEFLEGARHVEVQIVGDGSAVSHLHERECSLQRRHQKLVEIAPSPGLPGDVRARLTDASVRVAEAVAYRSLGTFEFLVSPQGEIAFIEANARLQVEHTVTEAVTGVDLVHAQLRIASGESLADVGLLQADVPAPRGHAIQVRVNMETLRKDGLALPSSRRITAFQPPSGPGVRTDTFGYTGYQPNTSFDSLLAKVIVHTPTGDFAAAVRRMRRALAEFEIEGPKTNLAFVQTLLEHPDVVTNAVHTGFVEEHLPALLAQMGERRTLYFGAESTDAPETTQESPPGLAGARVDTRDPLAVLAHGKSAGGSTSAVAVPPTAAPRRQAGPPGTFAVEAPLQGTIVSVDVAAGDAVRTDGPLLVMEAMKMEHVITAERSGIVRRVDVEPGDAVFEGHPLVHLEASDVEIGATEVAAEIDLDHIRPDLAEVQARHAVGLDAARPDAVARRRKTGQRTARENVDDLCDPGSYIEYGPLVVAAQRRRHSMEHLIERTPADGMIAGIGSVNAHLFPDVDARCVLMSYDYTVLAGTQGGQNHRKKDRMFELAERWQLPVVFFTEGGGGRPGDTDGIGSIGLECLAFLYFGRLSGLVPLVGINSGRCFAGNAALLGCCDVVIATANSNIGMGGPAMIEGGGLGVFRPEEIGPMEVQTRNGVVDIAVEDEAEAVAVAKQYLSYFQGPLADWTCDDQRKLRGIIPENRLRVYDVREVIATLADTDSVLELRRDFGLGMVTSLARVEGRPIGIVANNPTHLAGAIDSDAADKATRFMQLCDAFDIPLLFLCDTPGIMVGPQVEKTALVRHAARMFVTGASLDVPFFTIVLRKSYGLGAQAMAGGSFRAPLFSVSWPTGEFGGMGLEGAVKLGYRNELAAIEDPQERLALYEKMVDRMYEVGKAVNVSSTFELDDVIDPMESRRWVVRALESVPPAARRTGKKRPNVDTW